MNAQPPHPDALAAVARRYRELQERIAAAGGRDVTVIAVTKGFGAWAIDAAAACGITAVGESYAQECLPKLADVTAQPPPSIHFVGRLQRNKVQSLAAVVDVWQSVDRPELAAEIARRAAGAEVMIQVNISGESSKAGCDPANVDRLAEAVDRAGLRLTGLMGMAAAGEPAQARAAFRLLRRLVDSLALEHCCMGMTDDFSVAVSEGATMVRVGRSLFGERPQRGTANVSQ